MPKAKLFNGKPMSHWDAMAKELVVDILVRGASRYEGSIGTSLVYPTAYKRLMELAMTESPELTKKLLGERDRCRKNLSLFMKELTREEHRRSRRRRPRVARRSVSA